MIKAGGGLRRQRGRKTQGEYQGGPPPDIEEEGLLAENGDQLITEAGDRLILEG